MNGSLETIGRDAGSGFVERGAKSQLGGKVGVERADCDDYRKQVRAGRAMHDRIAAAMK